MGTAVGSPMPGSMARRSSNLLDAVWPLWLWATRASRIACVPARTWPCRLVALRQKGRASRPTPTTSARPKGKEVGKKGWVSATKGAPAAKRMASSRVARRARRGASAKSTPLSLLGKAPSDKARPSFLAERKALQKNGRASAMVARVTSTDATLGRIRSASAAATCTRTSDDAMTSPAMMTTSKTRNLARRRTRVHSVG